VDTSDSPARKEDDIVENAAPTRPEKLNTRVIRFMNDHEKWLAFVGLLNGRPYEIFTGKAKDAFDFPKYVKEGWIIKNGNGEGMSRYDFQYEDSDGYKITIEGLSRSFSQEYWNYAKLISGILRHGMPLLDVVDLVSNLNLDKDYINTWKNGVTRALKTFIPDGTRVPNRECPECGDLDGLIYEEGCLRCKSCSYTKCG
jgi:ribonucleoside-diphosphate reductase alpha chain